MALKLRTHAILALVFYLLTLGQQYLFYWLKAIPIIPFVPGKYLGIYFLFFIFTFIQGPRLRFFFLSGIFVLNSFQMGHLSYFGTQLLPGEIYQLVTQWGEVEGTLKEELRHVVVPLLMTLIPLGIGLYFHRRYVPAYRLRFLGLLCVLYVLYNPLRTYVTGNTWGRQPSTKELTGMNVYLAGSYFFGKILPYKLSLSGSAGEANSSLNVKIEGAKPAEWDKVIVVLGESLTPNHMSLFGYDRETTPFLKSRIDDKNFFYTVGLSGGVSTDISVAFLLNLGFGSAGVLKAAKGTQCLFRLAKDQSFHTHFLSVQSSEQLRYISPYLCSSFLDDYRGLEEISPATKDHQAAVDRDLLPHLEKLLQDPSKRFLILHQRGSHGPWELRSTEKSKLFSGNSDTETRIADYDNSVVEFDHFWRELHRILEAQKGRALVVYVSDHGEAVGEKNRWGHGFIEPLAFEIPVLITSYNKDLPSDVAEIPNFITHYNLGLFLARELGYETNVNYLERPSDYEIYGNDIDGFAGRARIKFLGKNYTFKYSP